jgi:phosphoribosylamine--glycine ligase
MRILVLGGGGREHAIVHALVNSYRSPEVFVAPGNGGTASIARNVSDLSIENARAVADWAAANTIDLVVIGPEGPLVSGVADGLQARGIKVFGPSALAARLEGSKAFAKGVMRRNDIPTGESRAFTAREFSQAQHMLERSAYPVVVKADGLAAGKGVVIASDFAEAEAAVRRSFDGSFGKAGETVLIEEYLEGPECSLLAFVDDGALQTMPPAQDHKRVFDGDEGPNTGGMGVYSPVPDVDATTLATMRDLLERTVRGMARENLQYRGVIYGGFILTGDGPKVLEYNARFGDPETQVLLPLMRSDLIDVMLAVVEGRLQEQRIQWSRDAAVCVVLASGGYPGAYESGKVISGVEDAAAMPGVFVYHAGTAVRQDGVLVTAGGRVLGVTAVGATIAEARDLAYEAARKISFDGMHMRTDIAHRALGGVR